ncbi:unnamed protein product [Boreogadus saida]
MPFKEDWSKTVALDEEPVVWWTSAQINRTTGQVYTSHLVALVPPSPMSQRYKRQDVIYTRRSIGSGI